MLNKTDHIPRLEFLIPAGSTSKYTTLLQAGIFVESRSTTTVGEFLSSLPGFTSDYILKRIETIFLNGLPVDDLEAVVGSSSPVLAISAAMPGLAGAIFRKNSFHAALRTSARNSMVGGQQKSEKVMVKLKFFNSIAGEKGGAILCNGCLVKSESLLRFISYRQQLFSDALYLSCDDEHVSLDDLKSILHKSETVFLRVQTEDGKI